MTIAPPQRDQQAAPSTRRGLTPLVKALLVIPVVYFGVIPIFWYLEEHVGVSHGVASNTMTVIHILCFATALALPWINLPGQERRPRYPRSSTPW